MHQKNPRIFGPKRQIQLSPFSETLDTPETLNPSVSVSEKKPCFQGFRCYVPKEYVSSGHEPLPISRQKRGTILKIPRMKWLQAPKSITGLEHFGLHMPD